MPCPGEEDNKGIWKITEEERTSGKLAEVREGGDSTIRANKIPGHPGVGAGGQLIIDLSDPDPSLTIATFQMTETFRQITETFRITEIFLQTTEIFKITEITGTFHFTGITETFRVHETFDNNNNKMDLNQGLT